MSETDAEIIQHVRMMDTPTDEIEKLPDDLRERVARAIYEGKRARLLEAFGDTEGWPEWETLRPTLQEIQKEECDPFIALIRAEVLEEAARELDGWGDIYGDNAAAAIRALGGSPPGSGGNVVPFSGVTTLDIDADAVLRGPLGALDAAIVAGIDKDGGEYFASSYGSLAETLFLLERYKKMLLELSDE